MTCSMKASRMTDWTPSTSTRPISGSTFGAARQITPPPSSAAATCARADVFPANTTGRPTPPAAASDRAASTTNLSSPPSVPPTSRTRSAADCRTSAASDVLPARVMIATIRPPEFSATCLAASAVRSRSSPAMATRRPPPALEQPSTGPAPAAATPAACNCPRAAEKPSIRSDSTVVRCCAEPTSTPDRESTAISFVNVLPKSTSSAGAVSPAPPGWLPPGMPRTRPSLPSPRPDTVTSAYCARNPPSMTSSVPVT